jgi:hypothetical protein
MRNTTRLLRIAKQLSLLASYARQIKRPPVIGMSNDWGSFQNQGLLSARYLPIILNPLYDMA